MKAIQPNQLLILGIALASSSMAAEVDLGFRYNQKDNICVNDRGQVGHNPDFMGECGMLSGKDLTWAIRTFPWDAMPGAILDDSILYGADFTNLNLMGASLRNADLRLISLDGANLSFANLTGSRFGNSFLSRANLTGANLSNLDLSDANVRMANFSKADLTAASFRANQNVHQAKFDEARLSTANLQGAYLYGASFRKANLAGADLSHSQLLRADLSVWCSRNYFRFGRKHQGALGSCYERKSL
ncbi:MAG: pentapeptide repeat-containing protein [Bdellovibrionales bacterium]|nr:pentapeptide repeat-containing protein [Bdellovibrionales bacterium]